MFLSLLFVMLTLQPVQDDVTSWVELIESGHLEQVEAEIRQHPEQTTPIVEELLSRFDSSVHSWRDRPEQRRAPVDMSLSFRHDRPKPTNPHPQVRIE